MLLGLEEMACEEKLREMVCSAWRRELGSPVAAFHCLWGVTGRMEPGSPHFQWKCSALIPSLFKQHPNDDYSPVANPKFSFSVIPR